MPDVEKNDNLRSFFLLTVNLNSSLRVEAGKVLLFFFSQGITKRKVQERDEIK